jgi:hypothetical protein
MASACAALRWLSNHFAERCRGGCASVYLFRMHGADPLFVAKGELAALMTEADGKGLGTP